MELDHDRGFEQGILRFIGIVGLLRMLYAVYINVVWDNPLVFWVMDSILGSVFLLLIIFSFYVQRIHLLTWPFSIMLWIMVSISFINTGGIYGMSEYNLLAVVIIMAMIHNGRVMLGFISLVLATLVFLTISWELDLSYLAWFEQIPTTGLMSYLLIVVLSTLGLSYLMLRSDNEAGRLSLKKIEMQERIDEIENENRKLEKQKVELNRVNDWLENRINERNKELIKSNQTIEEFLDISVQEFRPSIKSTVNAINELKKSDQQDPFVELLGNSAEKLTSAFDTVKRKIKSYHLSKTAND